LRIAIASILQESNTFSPVYTRYGDFTPVFGNAVLERHRGKLTEMGGFLNVLDRARVEVAPVCAAWAITANRLLRPDFEKLVSAFEDGLRRTHADALLLAMHGAQTAEGEDDVEGCVLSIVRKVLGRERPVVMSLDLHANVTRRMVELSDAVVGYHTYPHVDMFETGQKAARLMLRILKGECRPTMAFRKLPLIVPAENSQTHRGPMAKLIQSAQALQAGGKVEAVSIFPVQPWMDIAEMGCAVVAVTNDNAKAAQKHADALAARLWNNKKAYEVKLHSVPDALAAAEKIKGGPVVIAESSDSTGSGSPGDSTGVLKHLVKADLSGPAAIFLVDPAAVAKVAEAGVGATVKMSVGGAFDKKNSRPVPVTAYVKLISDGRWTARARGYNTGITTSMGRSAVVEVGRVQILIAERSSMTVDPELFRSHGLTPFIARL
jgi:microcystin degradation protein MlrC